MGGFFGAAVCAIWYLKKKKANLLLTADTIIFGLPIGLWVGRMGCFLIHDHPGKETVFPLGVLYPDGIVRHDHGFYLSLNGLLLALVFFWMAKRKVRTGMYLVVFLCWYGIVRFALDFFRAAEGGIVDDRYFGLTPAQYMSVAMITVGILINLKLVNKKQPLRTSD